MGRQLIFHIGETAADVEGQAQRRVELKRIYNMVDVLLISCPRIHSAVSLAENLDKADERVDRQFPVGRHIAVLLLVNHILSELQRGQVVTNH